jgi:protein involved in polysaccharide export with SLBB domain
MNSTQRSLSVSIALSGLCAVAACSTVPNLPPAPPTPAAQTVATNNSLAPYYLQVGDVLEVRLLLNPELNEEVVVRPDGHISTTVVADEVAAGRTVPEVTAALKRDYSHDLQNPRISVVVKSFAPTRIYVAGEVNNPGEFIDVGPNLTLSQAIARAGGVKEFSSDDGKVFVIRRGPGDAPQFLSTRLQDVMYGQDPAADIRLAPYDVVYVPRNGAEDAYRFFYSYFLRFVPVNWGFNYVVGAGAAGTTVVSH